MNKLSRPELHEKLAGIKLLALDVDGVLTDDGIYFGPDGFEMKKFNISDGFFIVLAMHSGLEIAIVSGRPSAATVTRMNDLGVKHVLMGRTRKSEMLAGLLEELKLTLDDVAFVGNEILDLELAEKVALPIAVADACDELKSMVAYVTEHKGGCGAVRELLEEYFFAKGISPLALLEERQ